MFWAFALFLTLAITFIFGLCFVQATTDLLLATDFDPRSDYAVLPCLTALGRRWAGNDNVVCGLHGTRR